MSLPTSSRFAVLQLVGDYEHKKSKKPPDNEQSSDNKAKPAKLKKEKQKKVMPVDEKTKPEEKPKTVQTKKKLEKKKKKQEEYITEKQWTKWQKKDAELVDGIFEKDLKEALLQSQIEFEKQRGKKEDPKPAEEIKKPKKARKITLQEFMAQSEAKEAKPAKPEPPKTFSFEEIDDRAREIVQKEQYRNMGCSSSGQEVVLKIDDSPKPSPTKETRKNSPESLEAIVAVLKAEVSEWQAKYEGAAKLLEEQSKLINLQLTNSTTESLLKRIDELQKQQVELYHEIGSLHVLLEQERSKNQADGSKIKNAGVKKSVRFSAA
ncbi:G kinase-anchoring protein 1-like isoform X2 [Phlebotomus argentipes]|uniref:G kinase-anchoring protein 1-like isoform X2 n=1 Tax=Phlebotomus argentipes TaxID=94469 RepID=UPI0028933252|nr:G kinase-anchoring protein 1-like isoform X2 [Phlebotomus argentipes]